MGKVKPGGCLLAYKHWQNPLHPNSSVGGLLFFCHPASPRSLEGPSGSVVDGLCKYCGGAIITEKESPIP